MKEITRKDLAAYTDAATKRDLDPVIRNHDSQSYNMDFYKFT